jgi:hypothetical protein
MAIAYARPQILSRSGGRSAVACAAYRSAQSLEDERQGIVHDYERRGGVLAEGILLPAHAPDWMRNRAQLWNAVERREDRSTRPDQAQLAREFVIALPHELDDQAREYLVKNILKEGAARKGMVADYAIHAPDREGDHRNYHAHVMLTMRRIDRADPDGFGPKAREWNSKKELEAFKNIIERETNRMLARHGITERITFILEDGREPQRHLGVNAAALERRGVATEAGKANRAIAERNRALAEARAVLAETTRDIALEQVRAWEPERGRLPSRFKKADPGEADLDKRKRAARLAATLYDEGGMASQQRDALRDHAERQRRAEQKRREQEQQRKREEEARANQQRREEEERRKRDPSAAVETQRQDEETDGNQQRSEKPARDPNRTSERERRRSPRSRDGRSGGGRGGGGRGRER